MTGSLAAISSKVLFRDNEGINGSWITVCLGDSSKTVPTGQLTGIDTVEIGELGVAAADSGELMTGSTSWFSRFTSKASDGE